MAIDDKVGANTAEEEAEAQHDSSPHETPLLLDQPEAAGKTAPSKKRQRHANCQARIALAGVIINGGLLIAAIYVGMIYSGQLTAMRDTLDATNRLVKSAQDQTTAAVESARTARAQLESSQRAWVAFKPTIPWPPLVVGQQYQVELLFENVGHSPAHNVKTHIAYAVGDKCGMPDRIDFEGPPVAEIGVMAPGIEYPATSGVLFTVTTELLTQFSPKADVPAPCGPPNSDPLAQVFRVYMQSLYADEFGANRGVRTCLEYNPRRERRFSFCRTGNDAW